MSKLYDTKKWKRKRAVILRRDKYLDQVEKRYGRMVEATIVHHIFPLDEYPQYATAAWNLISVSLATHNKLHNRDTNELTESGVELLRRIATRNGITIPTKYQ